jgi:regulator of cell morphogenesis and NO signaling
MNSISNTPEDESITVAQLAIDYPGALQVFVKYNIDYCCGGHRSLKDACIRVGLNPDRIKDEILKDARDATSNVFRVQNWSSSLLVDYIIENHHTYVKTAIPEIKALLDKVCDAHGEDSIELLSIRDDFNDLAEELLQHMQKEEFVLFPAIKRLERDINAKHPLAITIQAPVGALEHEHESAGELIKSIRLQAKNYTPPDFACPTFRITFKKLQEFDNDLMTHIHLENNILFERVKERAKPISGC